MKSLGLHLLADTALGLNNWSYISLNGIFQQLLPTTAISHSRVSNLMWNPVWINWMISRLRDVAIIWRIDLRYLFLQHPDCANDLLIPDRLAPFVSELLCTLINASQQQSNNCLVRNSAKRTCVESL